MTDERATPGPEPAAADTEAELAALVDAFTDQLRDGEQLTATQFADRHPRYRAALRELLSPIAAMEALKVERLSRPHWKRVERLGDFRLLDEIGRGGMGIVYDAVQVSLSRRVAVKVLPPSAFAEAAQVERFQREAEIASRLHHANIVPIYGTGFDHGVHYYAMQRVDGGALDHYADRRPTGAGALEHEVARIGVQAARALHHAHAQGVLHRDVKPANLLLDPHGTVWITDFGIGKLLDQQAVTRTRDFVGSLAYAAPEVLDGRFDARSDQYGLGVTLFELLTGQRAFHASGRGALVKQISAQGVPDLAAQRPATPRDLRTVIARATSIDAAHRYPDCAALADDLQRFLDGVPVRARRVGAFERAWRWTRRNPGQAISAATAIGATLTAAAVGWLAYLQADASLRRERDANDRVQNSLRGQRVATARAEQNLDLSLQAFDDLFDAIAGRDRGLVMLDDASETVPVVPVVSARELELLERLCTFYDAFALHNDGNVRLHQDTARALRRVGDIHRWLGHNDDAETAYRRALAIHGQDAGDPAAALASAVVRRSLGHVLEDRGDRSGAREEFRAAIHQLERLLLAATGGAEELQGRYELAAVLNDLGALQRIGRLPDTLPRARRDRQPRHGMGAPHERALQLAEGLLEAEPDNPAFRMLEARSRQLLARMLFRSGEVLAAGEQAATAIRTLDELAANHPDIPDHECELIESYLMLASHQQLLDEALAASRTAVDRARQLRDRYRALPRCSELYGRARLLHGRLLTEQASATADAATATDLRQRADVDFAAAIDVLEPLWQEYPSAVHQLWRLIEALHTAAANDLERGDPALARERLTAALARAADLTALRPHLAWRAAPWDRIYRPLAAACRALGDDAGVQQAEREAAAHAERRAQARRERGDPSRRPRSR